MKQPSPHSVPHLSQEEKRSAYHADMTETPVNRLIVRLAIPSILTMMITSIYNTADAIREIGFITLRGYGHGTAVPAKITTDAEDAVRGAEAIFVHVISDRHEEIARAIAPYVEDGQHILIIPGNLGSFVFRRVFQEMGVTAKVTLTEKEGNFCPCRLTAPAEVILGKKPNNGRVCSLPASDTQRVLKDLEGVVQYSANQNVFEAVINSGNMLTHIASTVLSAAEIEHKGKDFSIFKYSFTPATVRCINQIRNERLAVIKAMGMTEHVAFNPEKYQNIGAYPDSKIFYENMNGPHTLEHRFLTEDCSCSGAFAVSMGKRLGLELPLLSAFLVVAGTITNRDYLKDGRTLENLGFPKEMTLSEIYAQL